jgi:ankyrin repeat protein
MQHIVARANDVHALATLLSLGVNTAATNKSGHTAMDVARHSNSHGFHKSLGDYISAQSAKRRAQELLDKAVLAAAGSLTYECSITGLFPLSCRSLL